MIVYATNHTNSRVVSTAFSQGHDCRIAPPNVLLEGPAVCYGILRGTGDIIRQCEWIGRDYYYIDHGYFGRGKKYDGYYRIVKNGLQTDTLPNLRSPERFEKIGELRPWKRSGEHIVICPISRYLADHLGISETRWTDLVVRELNRFTDRPIVVKPKDGKPLSEVLKEAWCLVTHSSNAGIDAIVSGIPAVCLGKSAAKPVSWTFEDIESPRWPAREHWAYTLAHHQFTLDEMRQGIDLEML